MNKTAIKNFAIWARNKLIADITYKAGLLGITDKVIKEPLPQSTKDVQFFDIGTKEPYSISGEEIKQRDKLIELIINKSNQTDYSTAYKSVVGEVAYTWFNRLIAIRFMEINDYLPSRIRVLSSESANKSEPDLVTTPFDSDLEFTPYEKDRITQLKQDNQLDQLFRMLFIMQCNAMNLILPELFEKTSDYTELLLNVAFTDKDGVVFHLVNDIQEDDFNVSKEGQVEIIGWMYQYYNTEPKDEVFALLKKNVKITKERIPAATQLFTPDWIVRYMVENSLGRLWIEGHPNDDLKDQWNYYLDEAEQEADVQKQLEVICEEYKTIKPEDIKVIDPCMGSGHILVYAFDVLMQIYESQGYSQRDAAKSIVENNLYGLDIDNRACQLAYFAVMMKARQHNRRILNGENVCRLYSIQEGNLINHGQLKYFGLGMNAIDRNTATSQIQYLLDIFKDAKEYGSILNVDNCDWELLNKFTEIADLSGQVSLDAIGLEDTQKQLLRLVEVAATMAQKYDVVVTNPPYMGSRNMGDKLANYVKDNFPDSKADLFAVFIEKCNFMAKPYRFQAMITQHTWMFISSFERTREKAITQDTINMVHLGSRAFEEIGGEVVQTTSFVFRKSSTDNYCGKFIRLVEYGSQEGKRNEFHNSKNYHYINSAMFHNIPGSPFAYWLSKDLYKKYNSNLHISDLGEIKQGLATCNNALFVRDWTEVKFSKIGFGNESAEMGANSRDKWFPYNKGGGFRKWYGNNVSIVNWEDNGIAIHQYNKIPLTHNGAPVRAKRYYFREGITYNLISSSSFSARYIQNGFIFDVGGSMIFPIQIDAWYLLSLLCSKVAEYLLKAINPTLNYQVGDVGKIVVIADNNICEECISIAHANVAMCKFDWDSFETSWDFVRHPLLSQKISNSIGESYIKWELLTVSHYEKLRENEESLNRIFIKLYDLQDALSSEIDDKAVTISKADSQRDVRSFISYAIGCVLGRYSLDADGLVYAGGDWDDSKYCTFIPDKDNILPITDEEYFEDDIVGQFCKFVKVTFGEDTLEENLDFIANALGNKGNTSREIIRYYFVSDFFKDHCKIYQKRPIYWLFDSGKADGFKALIYMHRYDENTVGNLRIDYLHHMQRVYDREIARMQETIDNSTNAREVTAAEKRKEKLTKQLKETKDYDEKIAHLALARIAIDLDDGVKVNYEKVQTGADGKMLEVLAGI